MKLFRFLIFTFLLIPVIVIAQNGFSAYNGRNHPELKWRFLETEHVRIIYHQPLESRAKEAGDIAESCFSVISQNLNFTPKGKIPIYITDQDDITNGFSAVNKYIGIWVNMNDFTSWTTGSDKWMRMVIGHEMVHFIHFCKINTWLGLLGAGMSGTPGWFIEGLAQYESETWNVHRGDQLLRSAVMEDEINYSSGLWPTNGRLMYAKGNSMVRYIADTYGDSSLIKMLDYRKKILGVPFYSFGGGFNKALNKKPFEDFDREWRRHVNIYYNTAQGQKEDVNEISKKLNLAMVYTNGVQISPDSLWIACAGLLDLNEPLTKLCLVKNDSTKKLKILVQSGVDDHFSFSPDSKHLTYSRTRRGTHGSLQQDIFVCDLKGRSKRLTTNYSASQPDWAKNGEWIAFIVEKDETANIFKIKPDGSGLGQVTRFTGDVQIQTPRWSPAGDKIVFALADTNGSRDVAFVDVKTGHVVKVTDNEFDNRSPVWSPDGRSIAFTGYSTGVPSIYTKSLETDSLVQNTDTASGLYCAQWTDSLLCISINSRRKSEVVKLAVNRHAEITDINIKPKYTSWMTHTPAFGLPPMLKSEIKPTPIVKQGVYHPLANIQHYVTLPLPNKIEDDWGLLFMTAWAEPLGKHEFTALGFLNAEQPKETRFFSAYINNSFYPTITTTAFRMPSTGQIIDGKTLIEETKGGFLDMAFPLNFGNDLYSNHFISLSAAWTRNDPYDKEKFVNSIIPVESKSVGEFGISYYWKKQRPNNNNIIQPSQGMGVKLDARAADQRWNSDLTFQKYSADGFVNIAVSGSQNVLYLRAMGQASNGRLLAQDFIGFDKYDQPDFGDGMRFSDRERVRGISEYLFGDRLWLGTLEYRMDFMDNLGVQAMGIMLQRVTLAAFTDVGSTWFKKSANLKNAKIYKTYGIELKNLVNFGGLQFTHQVGWAWQYNSSANPELYYRIRAVAPF